MIVIFIWLFFLLSREVHASQIYQSLPVTVSAAIGDNYITLTGYACPECRIELSNAKTYAVTYSRTDGYFIFDHLLLPKDPGEPCLYAIDDSSRRSMPVCIPRPPIYNYHTSIGPVLLPPTVSLNDDQVKPLSTTAASGQSIPNSSVNIYFYQIDKHPGSFPKAAMAFSLPILSLITDASGNYSFNLPTTYSSGYRFYTAVSYLDSLSPKSNTLTFFLPPQNSVYLYLFATLFLLSLAVFAYLLSLYYHRQPPRYLPAIFSYPLTTFKSSNIN
jgi:hypothetical protein